MTIQPINRFILLTRCASPRKHGVIENPGETLAFGLVQRLAPDCTTVKVGDVVFFDGRGGVPILDDGDVGKTLINELQVIAIVSDVVPVPLDNTIPPQEAKGQILKPVRLVTDE